MWQALAAGALREPGRVVVAVLDTGHPDLLSNLDAAAGLAVQRTPAGVRLPVMPCTTGPSSAERDEVCTLIWKSATTR